MKTIKYRFKQIQKLGKLFGVIYSIGDRYIGGVTKDGKHLTLSNNNYNTELNTFISYNLKNILYTETSIVREGKLVCIFIDYPNLYVSKVKMFNKPLFNKHICNILGRRSNALKNNTIYYYKLNI